MKKHNISRTKRTYKKYNKTQFRNFNKYTNLTSSMKGGVKWSLFGTSAKSVETAKWKGELETLRNNIRDDTTFEWAGAPINNLNKNLTKADVNKWVVNAIQFVDAQLTISEEKIRQLQLYMRHYKNRQDYESAYKANTLKPATRYDRIPYSEMKLRAENLLQNINIIDDNSELKEWLETYIRFLDNFTYFSDMQEDKIMKMLEEIEEDVNQANFKSRLQEGYARRVDADRIAATEAKATAEETGATEEKGATKEKGATEEKAPKDRSIFSIFGNMQQPSRVSDESSLEPPQPGSYASESRLPESTISMPRLRSGFRPRPTNINPIKVGGKSKHRFKRNIKSKTKRKTAVKR
jgi:hypothetical protein